MGELPQSPPYRPPAIVSLLLEPLIQHLAGAVDPCRTLVQRDSLFVGTPVISSQEY